ncbi:MAG: hypothetical protein DI527_00470 [Chelatococcus sp.]|nr:MAG: hypothetical protein DI527_00470 [Chelatococcus sp.]
MSRKLCCTCQWWDNSASSAVSAAETGQCRRLPPGFDDRTGLAVWPFTEETDWCGEFALDEARDEEEAGG